MALLRGTKKDKEQTGIRHKKNSPATTHSDIEKRAYEIFLERNKKGLAGDSITDWLNAEREIMKKIGKK